MQQFLGIPVDTGSMSIEQLQKARKQAKIYMESDFLGYRNDAKEVVTTLNAQIVRRKIAMHRHPFGWA